MTTRWAKIEIIFDVGRGRFYGWRARATDADGRHENDEVSEDWWEDALASDQTILAWAVKYYFEPDGMTDAEIEDLRNRIEIKRRDKRK